MRPPSYPWANPEEKRRARERFLALSDEEQAKELGITIEAHRRLCAAGQGLGRAIVKSLFRPAKGKP